MAYRPPTPAPVSVVVDASTIRPAVPEGDGFFGLSVGSNGTAAEARRRVAELSTPTFAGNAHGFTWVRANGAPAHGVQYVPGDSENVNANPWSGQP